MQHEYDAGFMNYADRSSRHSAQLIASILRGTLPITSVLDVGCAKGTWLAAWHKAGVEDFQGVDGAYAAEDLVIPRERFVAADLSKPFTLHRMFDLVQTLEVAEHIPASAAEQFVDNIAAHCTGFVLFSAAPPGQGGEFHVNEQPYDYWREKFRRRGYQAFDYIRPLIQDDKRVSFWYRYNVILYVHDSRIEQLPAVVAATRVVDSQALPDVSPFWFRGRKMLVQLLPDALRQKLASLKANAWRKRGAAG